MKKKKVSMGLAVLVAILMLGIGYAVATSVTLSITAQATATSTQSDFVVKFTGTPSSTGGVSTAMILTDTTATVTASLSSSTASTATFTVLNDSAELGAKFTPTISNKTDDCDTYFNIAVTPTSETTLTHGNTTDVVVSITRKKVPTEDKSCNFNVGIEATPVES